MNVTRTHKLINNPEDVVDESLNGFISVHPETQLLPTCKRVVVRSDLSNHLSSGRVSLICGGGSGHEPVFAGYVGAGCLTAAIAGNVFASPPPKHIIAALKATQSKGGTIVFVINYTGDRLNFGMAIERFKKDPNTLDSPIEMVILGEDCALTSIDQSAGRRGLAGCLIVLKICGSMAEAGMDFKSIVCAAKSISQSVGTIGLSLSSCSLPGSGPLFSLPHGEMELGLGVHGEPGVKRMPLASAHDTVNIMMNAMTNPASQTKLTIEKGEEVVLLLNNLGSMTSIEMNILSREVLDWLVGKEVHVKRLILGPMMTSLEMQGFSITVLKVKDVKWVEHLDTPTLCSGWPKHSRSEPVVILPKQLESAEDNFKDLYKTVNSNQFCNVKDASVVQQMLESACNAIIQAETELNDLDSKAGDGDCGSTMRRGVQAILARNSDLTYPTPCILLGQLSHIWEEATGGTSGPIYAIVFDRVSKELEKEVSSSTILHGLVEGTKAVMQYGQAVPGHRTMIDALIAVNEFQNIPTEELDWGLVVSKVEEAAAKTAGMIGRAGRSSYVQASNCSLMDPGARAVAIWIKAAFNSYNSWSSTT